MGSGYIYVVACLASVALASFVIYDEERMKLSRFALGIILLAALVKPLRLRSYKKLLDRV